MRKMKTDSAGNEIDWNIPLLVFLFIPIFYFINSHGNNRPGLGEENRQRCLTVMQSISRAMETRGDQPGDSRLRRFPLRRLVQDRHLAVLPEEPLRGEYRIVRDQGWRVECSLHGDLHHLEDTIRNSMQYRMSLSNSSSVVKMRIWVGLSLLGLILLMTAWYLRSHLLAQVMLIVINLILLVDAFL